MGARVRDHVQGLGSRVRVQGSIPGFRVEGQGSGPAASKGVASVGPSDTLSICCDIVRLHWGELQPLQSPGCLAQEHLGSVWHFTLPEISFTMNNLLQYLYHMTDVIPSLLGMCDVSSHPLKCVR